MKRFNLIAGMVVTLLVCGCSSPPKPTPVEWDKTPGKVINSGLPEWQENQVVVPSPDVQGHWSYTVQNFDAEREYPLSFYFAVAHSPQITVMAPDATAYFATTAWLRQHGAKGVILFRQKNTLLNTTEISLSR